jgi:hypothetical protein
MRAFSAGLAGLVLLAACSSPAKVPVTQPPGTHVPVTQGDRARAQPGDVVLAPGDNGRVVRIRVGQTATVILPYAARVVISSWMAVISVPASPGVHSVAGPVVLSALGSGRFRALSAGRARLLAFRPCSGTACSEAYSWSADLTILPSSPRDGG